MPCDSPAAGLVTLGSVIRDLGSQKAKELDGHTKRLVEHARHFINHCRRCALDVCDPKLRGCGHTAKAVGVFRSTKPQYQSVKYEIRRLGDDPECTVWLLPKFKYAGGNMCPTIEELDEFYIDGYPPTQWNGQVGEVQPEMYACLVPEAQILPENLRRSYSGLCFAGRVAGETHSRKACALIRFRDGDSETGLDDLLTVHEWAPSIISRVSFFNARTLENDRGSVSTSITVSDGDASFLKIIDRTDFEHSDVVAVVDRTLERDRLEAVGDKLSDNTQWYKPDVDLLNALLPAPRGISIIILRRS